MNQHISLSIITKNEQENIAKNFNWLKKVKSIDEIILVDDYSDDRTIDILKSKLNSHQTLKVFKRKLDGDFSAQRNFALSKSKNNWILWLDADEKPRKTMINFIKQFSPQNNFDSYSFLRQDIFWGKKLNYGQNISFHTRLFNKKYGKFIGKVHETWQSKKNSKTNHLFFHHSCQNLTQILQKINFYTDIRAKELFEKGIKTNLLQIIFFPVSKFIQNYLIKFGFLDSTRGIILSLLMSLHSFLVRAKLWHLSTQHSST